MPNHIQNRLQVIGDNQEVQKVFTAIKGEPFDDGTPMKIDFDKIIPRPKALDITSDGWLMPIEHYPYPNPAADNGIMEHLKKLKAHCDKNPERKEEDLNNFLQGIRNYIDFGYATWYKWCVAVWGTKWNAYSQDDKRDTADTIYFQTAWNSPVKVITKLSEMFPLVKFDLAYADEDSGSNAGKILFENGRVITENKPQGQSMEAYDIFFELHPDSKENYKLVEGKYEYVEED
jgi:hypothetical protein